jgi:hypothetical protein
MWVASDDTKPKKGKVGGTKNKQSACQSTSSQNTLPSGISMVQSDNVAGRSQHAPSLQMRTQVNRNDSVANLD